MNHKPMEESANKIPPEAKEPITVAIVEDDAAVRAILCDWIREADGFRCVNDFGDAEAAVANLPGNAPDVLLLDINLPGMNGVECLLCLKHRLPHTQFIMLTVYEDADHIFDALAAGATGYLLKRTRREELLTALREVHAGVYGAHHLPRLAAGRAQPAQAERGGAPEKRAAPLYLPTHHEDPVADMTSTSHSMSGWRTEKSLKV